MKISPDQWFQSHLKILCPETSLFSQLAERSQFFESRFPEPALALSVVFAFLRDGFRRPTGAQSQREVHRWREEIPALERRGRMHQRQRAQPPTINAFIKDGIRRDAFGRKSPSRGRAAHFLRQVLCIGGQPGIGDAALREFSPKQGWLIDNGGASPGCAKTRDAIRGASRADCVRSR